MPIAYTCSSVRSSIGLFIEYFYWSKNDIVLCENKLICLCSIGTKNKTNLIWKGRLSVIWIDKKTWTSPQVQMQGVLWYV